MRAYEFLSETASSGATSAGAIATVAHPQVHSGGTVGFFGSGSPIVLKRSNSENTRGKKRKKKIN